MTFDRRSFLKTSILLGGTGLGIIPSLSADTMKLMKNELLSQGPIQQIKKFEGSKLFTGDHEMAGHEIFWDRPGFFRKYGPIPPATKFYDVVVIGGGMAGLTSTYLHRNQNTLLLEGHQQMGGNSKAERYQNISMSLGAAYINIPGSGDPLDLFLSELGVKHLFRQEQTEEFSIGLNGKIKNDFWNRGEEFKRVFDKFTSIYEHDYPELPGYPEAGDRERLNAMDQLSFSQWMRENLGDIHPQIEEFFHLYCWSSFGGHPAELSAAQVVGFIASDLNGVQALPGGNAVIAEAIYKKLKGTQVRMCNNAFAVNVKDTPDGVEVTYFEDQKRLITVKAKKVIMAMPKQVAKYLIQDLPRSQYEAMQAIKYRAYLLVNVLLNKKITSRGYDIFALKGKVPATSKSIDERGFCDILFADWANFDHADLSALTLYIPQPYEGANQFLFSPYTYEKHKKRIMENLDPWLHQMNLTSENIKGMRMTRYGHALPLAKVGMISSGILENAHQRVGQSIYFAHSDNWANPCLETAFYSARAAFA